MRPLQPSAVRTHARVEIHEVARENRAVGSAGRRGVAHGGGRVLEVLEPGAGGAVTLSGAAVVEFVCAAVLLASGFVKPLPRWGPHAAWFLVAEMLLYTGMHFASGAAADGQVAYWLVVAVICAGFACGRRVKPV